MGRKLNDKTGWPASQRSQDLGASFVDSAESLIDAQSITFPGFGFHGFRMVPT